MNRRYDILVWIIVILLVLIMLGIGSCTSTKRYSSEYFFYDDNSREIYHVSSKRDTTLLDWGDIRILGIDSLRMKYLLYKAER